LAINSLPIIDEGGCTQFPEAAQNSHENKAQIRQTLKIESNPFFSIAFPQEHHTKFFSSIFFLHPVTTPIHSNCYQHTEKPLFSNQRKHYHKLNNNTVISHNHKPIS
jgi:hypothetical protein